MSRDKEQRPMSSGRALLTDREREILAGDADVKDNYRYKVESNVRQRISRLESDAEVLSENYPKMYESLQSMVCNDD